MDLLIKGLTKLEGIYNAMNLTVEDIQHLAVVSKLKLQNNLLDTI